jgi:hypothetical protein
LSLLEMEAETWGPLFLIGLIVVVVLFFMSGKRDDDKYEAPHR